MSFTGIWEQYNPHILHWLIVRELVQLEIIRFRAVYLTALFFLLNQMLSLRIISNLYLFRTPLVKNDIRVSVQSFTDSCERIDSMLSG